MKLEASPIEENSAGMTQILCQLETISLYLQDMKKSQKVREEFWCTKCKEKVHYPMFIDYLASGVPNPLNQRPDLWCDI